MTHSEKFKQYHSENPHMYTMFERIAFDLIDRGYSHYSARDIFPIIRWETKTKAEGDKFKVNNNYSPDYARMFEARHPRYKGFFEKRERRAA